MSTYIYIVQSLPLQHAQPSMVWKILGSMAPSVYTAEGVEFSWQTQPMSCVHRSWFIFPGFNKANMASVKGKWLGFFWVLNDYTILQLYTKTTSDGHFTSWELWNSSGFPPHFETQHTSQISQINVLHNTKTLQRVKRFSHGVDSSWVIRMHIVSGAQQWRTQNTAPEAAPGWASSWWFSSVKNIINNSETVAVCMNVRDNISGMQKCCRIWIRTWFFPYFSSKITVFPYFFHIFPLVKSQFLRVKSLLEKIAIQLEMWPRLACGENRMM